MKKLLIILILFTWACGASKQQTYSFNHNKDFQSNYNDFIYAIFEKKDLSKEQIVEECRQRLVELEKKIKKLHDDIEGFLLYAKYYSQKMEKEEQKIAINTHFKVMIKIHKPRVEFLEQEIILINEIPYISNNQTLERVINHNIKQFDNNLKLSKQKIDEAIKTISEVKEFPQEGIDKEEYEFVEKKRSIITDINKSLGRVVQRLYGLVGQIYDKSEDRQGQVIEHYTNGNIQAKYTYQNGLKHGEVIYYDIEGKIQYKYNYVKGLKQGEAIKYSYSGKVLYKYNYKDGLKHGDYIGYSNDGEITYKGKYKNGLQQGEAIYYTDGKIKSIINYKDGLKHGERIRYYLNGNISSKSNYNEGKLQKKIRYDKSGKIK